MGSGVACPYILCECRRAQLINKGNVKHKLELRADPAPRWLFLGVFLMLFAISPAPAARGVAGQMAFGLPAVPGRRPRGRSAARGRPALSHFGVEAARTRFLPRFRPGKAGRACGMR